MKKHKLLNSPVFFGFGMMAITIICQTTLSTYMYYYVDVLGVSVAMLTLAKSVYMVWDVINDAIFASVSDRTKSKIGRRKFWLALSFPLYLMGFLLIFNPPASFAAADDKTRLAFWLFIMLMVFETANAIQWANYGALQPEIYSGDKERSRAGMFSVVGEIIGIIVATVVSVELWNAFGFGMMAVILSVAYAVFMGVFIFFLKEDPARQHEKQEGFIKGCLQAFKSKDMWIFNIANCFAQTANSMLGAGLFFYAKYCLNIEGSGITVMMAAAFVPCIFLTKIWAVIINKLGAKKAWKVSFAVYAVCVLGLLMADNFVTGIIACLFVGFGMSGYLITPGVMSGRVVDDDYLRYGVRREGLITSIMSLVRQLSSVLSTIAFFILGMLTGYESGEVPGPNPDFTFRLYMGAIPCVMIVIALALSFFCKGYNKDLSAELSLKSAEQSGEGLKA